MMAVVAPRPRPKKPSREEKKALTRARLLDAAATVFARRGFAAASLDEVAEEAGLTKGAVYSNFESKDELIGGKRQRVAVLGCMRFDRPGHPGLQFPVVTPEALL